MFCGLFSGIPKEIDGNSCREIGKEEIARLGEVEREKEKREKNARESDQEDPTSAFAKDIEPGSVVEECFFEQEHSYGIGEEKEKRATEGEKYESERAGEVEVVTGGGPHQDGRQMPTRPVEWYGYIGT